MHVVSCFTIHVHDIMFPRTVCVGPTAFHTIGPTHVGSLLLPEMFYDWMRLLRPWLVPSSGVTGIADDRIYQCCPVCCVVLFLPYLFTHLLTLGLAALFFFSLVCPHL